MWEEGKEEKKDERKEGRKFSLSKINEPVHILLT